MIRNWNHVNLYTISIWFSISGFFAYRFYQHIPHLNQLLNKLNEQLPELEFSSSILVKENEHLNTIEQLQYNKLNNNLDKLKWSPTWNHQLILTSISGIFLFVLITYISGQSTFVPPFSKSETTIEMADDKPERLNNINLEDASISINPPSYTLKSSISQGLGPINIREGSQVEWKFQFNQDPEHFSLSLSGDIYDLAGIKTHKETIYESSFYQFSYDSDSSEIVSDYFPIKVMRDNEPEINVRGIQEYTISEYDPAYQINFNIEIKDDYIINDAYITATVAKGSGESVKFREKRIEIPGFKSDSSVKAECTLNLDDLDMEPGSELYFYVSAIDNCSFRINKSKSQTYIFVFEDTASYDVWDDGGMQVDLMPDFFRSQRQIIIDSEKLLKDKSNISKQQFNQRSNELGFDQKQLRLKYGQFLGEESESGIAIEPDIEGDNDHDHHAGQLPGENQILDWGREVLEQFGHDHDHENEAGQRFEEAGTRKKEDPARPSWVEKLSHNHDNAEMNTYFELPVKSKLRAALSKMWDSELHLRLYDPKTSLPFQYNALNLLQEIKNHARIYVHRLGFDPPPIKEEKRLSGDQNEIIPSYFLTEYDHDNLVKYLSELNRYVSELKSRSGGKLTFDEKSDIKDLADSISAYAPEQLDLLPLLSIIQDLIQEGATITLYTLTKIQQKILTFSPKDGPRNIKNNQMAISKLKSNLINLHKSSN